MTDQTNKQETNSTPTTMSWWHRLATRLTVSFQLLGLLPVLIVTLVVLNWMSTQARDQVYNQLDSVAELKNDQITRWLDEGNLAMDVLLSGSNPERFANFIEAPASAVQERTEISGLLTGAVESQYFKRIFIYDKNGYIAASSEPNDIGKTVKDQPYFNIGLHADYIQPPSVDPATNRPAMYITRPIRTGKIQASGVLVGELNMETLSNIMTKRTGLGETGETYLVSLQNNKFLTPSRFEGYGMNVAYHTEGIDRGLEGIKEHSTYADYRSIPVLGSYRFIPELQAALLAEIDQSQALATYREVQTLAIIIALLAAFASLLVGFFVSRSIARPLSELTISAQRIGAGDLQTKVAGLLQQGEIGVLARTFKSMQEELISSYETLEQRVAARTRDLEIVAEVGTATSTILEPKRLLQAVVDLTKERFNLYHAHIYLLDEQGKNLILAAGAGEPGRIMVAEGRSIPLDREQSLVARAARERKGVTVNDVTQAPDFLPNALLPDTRSEMAVPMIVGGKVIGVFDLQSDTVGRFTEAEISVGTTLASLVATSVQNARSFDQSRKQAEFESMINAVGQKIQHATSIEETLQTGIRELGSAIGVSRVRVSLSPREHDSNSIGDS